MKERLAAARKLGDVADISTHAPVKERLENLRNKKETQQYFNSRSCEGATRGRGEFRGSGGYISTHAPVKERRGHGGDEVDVVEISTHAPVKERPVISPRRSSIVNFNSRSCEGATS